MNTDEKARRLLSDAWNHFWRHCGDPSAYYVDYMDNEDLDEVMALAGRIMQEGALEAPERDKASTIAASTTLSYTRSGSRMYFGFGPPEVKA